MEMLSPLSLLSFLLHIFTALGATLQSSSGFQLDSNSNLTTATVPSTFFNQTLLNDCVRYYVPDSPIALDFYDYAAMKSIIRVDALMAVVEGLSKIFGKSPTDTVPELNTFSYKRYAFVHIQDLNPTVGRHHTYADMAATLRGVGEYMTEYSKFRELEFQIWSVTPQGQSKIGSGAVGGSTPSSEMMDGGDTSTS